MKIALCSDLHLEFEDIDLKNTESAEVLILSGDIMLAEDLHITPRLWLAHMNLILNWVQDKKPHNGFVLSLLE